MNSERFQRNFMSRMSNPLQFAGLLDQLPDVCFFLKTRDSEFVMANRNFLGILGVSDVQDAVSRTDTDFFEYEVARRYIDDDLEVVKSKQPLTDRIWLIPNLKLGTYSYFRSSKVPVYSGRGSVIGLAGILRAVPGNEVAALSCDKMAKVVDYMAANFQQNVTLEELADQVHMSVRQFERRFRHVLHVSPVQYLIRMRISAACRLLRATNRTLTDIALDVGFCDHCYFCRQFRKCTGMTPGQYRATQGAELDQRSLVAFVHKPG